MALDTYANLKSAIASWNIDRTDLPDSDIVTLAEARLFRELQLRTMEAETDLTGVVDSRYIALPSGFLEPIGLFINISGSGREELEFVPADIESVDATGQPEYWTIDGTNIAFERPCDQAYSFTLRSLQSLTALSDSNTSNWLLANHPDLYLAACNVEAAMWLEDDDQIARWQPRYAEALLSVNNQANRSRSLATLRVDPALQPAFMANRWSGYDITRDQ